MEKKCIISMDSLLDNYLQQISNLRKLQKNLTVEKISKNYRKNKENGKEAIDNLFNQLNLKCKQKNIQGEVARFGSPNTVYFGGSLNYSTYFRFDDIQILSETLQTNKFAADSCFLCGTIVDKLIENIEDLLKRDRKFDYDHHCKNVSYRLQEIDYFKPKRIQIFRALFGRTAAFSEWSELTTLNEIDRLIYTCTIENNFFHSYNYDKLRKSPVKGNELILFFFQFTCITDYSIIDDKFVVFFEEDFKLHIVSLYIPNGQYSLEDISKIIEIPHEDICSCSDVDCFRKVVAHPMCIDHFIIYGVNWCLLFKISNKNDPDSFKSNEIVIQMQGESNNSNDDDNSDSECADFVPPDICCEVILQESIGSSNNDENQAIITAIEINVSDFNNFAGATFIPYKGNCRDFVLIDSNRLYTINLDTFKFGPCANSFLKKHDEYDEIIQCEHAYPYIILQTKQQLFYYVWREKRSLQSNFAVSGFSFSEIPVMCTEPKDKEEYDFYAIGCFTPINSKQKGFCEIFHRYRQKITIFFKSYEMCEAVDLKIQTIDSKSYLIIQLDEQNILIAPLFRNYIVN